MVDWSLTVKNVLFNSLNQRESTKYQAFTERKIISKFPSFTTKSRRTTDQCPPNKHKLLDFTGCKKGERKKERKGVGSSVFGYLASEFFQQKMTVVIHNLLWKEQANIKRQS